MSRYFNISYFRIRHPDAIRRYKGQGTILKRERKQKSAGFFKTKDESLWKFWLKPVKVFRKIRD